MRRKTVGLIAALVLLWVGPLGCGAKRGGLDTDLGAGQTAMPEIDDAVFVRLFEEARELHFQAVRQTGRVNPEADLMLRELFSMRPDDALVVVYHGSSVLLSAKTAPKLGDRLRLARSGLSTMDRAVELAEGSTDAAHVRLVRGLSTRTLPGMFDRAEQSEEDLKFAGNHTGALSSTLLAALRHTQTGGKTP